MDAPVISSGHDAQNRTEPYQRTPPIFTAAQATIQDAASPSHEPSELGKADELFDPAHLSKYTMGNRAVEHEILTLFLQQLPTMLRDLKGASPGEPTIHAAHTLRGCSLAIGAGALAASAANLERLTRAGDVVSDGEVAEVLDMAEMTRAQIEMAMRE